MSQLTYTPEGDPYWIPDPVENKLYPTAGKNEVSKLETYASQLPLPVDLGTHNPYVPTSGQNLMSIMTGGNGQERHQMWPEKMARSAATLPLDVMTGKVDPTSEVGIERTQDLAGLAGVGPLAMKPGMATMGSGMTRRMNTDELKSFMKSWDDKGVRNYVAEQSEAVGGNLKLHDLVVPKDQRKQGVGSEYMNELVNMADETGKTLVLTAAKDYGATSLDRLKGFYKRFGFVENKGRNKDFAISDNMYRKPKSEAKAEPKLTPVEGNPFALKSDTNVGTGIAAVKNAGLSPNKMGFFTAIEAALPKIDMKAGTKEQWVNAFKKYGVGKEEMQYTGLDSLPHGKLTRQQVEQHIVENKVELKDVWKGELKFNKNSKYALPEVIRAAKEAGSTPGDLELVLANDGNAYRALTKKFPQLSENERWAEVVSKDVFGGDSVPSGTSKYSQYQMPGGENYKELLLTLPEKKYSEVNVFQEFKPILNEIKTVADVALARRHNPNFRETAKNYTDGQVLDLVNKAKELPEYQAPYISSHWPEDVNPVAHVRMNDRFIPDKNGPTSSQPHDLQSYLQYNKLEDNKVNRQSFARWANSGKIGSNEAKGYKSLHVEEIQSDWHQTGRKKGYKDNSPNLTEAELNEYDKLANKTVKGQLTSAENKRLDELKAKADAFTKSYEGVPDAPFKANWDELALKRVIRHAVENGYDAISWTPGKSQSTNPSQHVDKIQYNTQTQQLSGHKGNKVLVDKTATPEELSGIVGKELAERLMNKPTIRIHSKVDKDNLRPDEQATAKYITDWDKTVAEQKKIQEAEPHNWHNNERFKQLADHLNTLHEKMIDETASRITEGKGNIHQLSDVDLEIGGTKEFYDKILVDKANKLGKQYGAKVETNVGPPKKEHTVEEIKALAKTLYETYDRKGGEPLYKDLSLRQQEFYYNEAKRKAYLADNPTPEVHVMRITPEMRKAVLEKGFPLFSASPILTPVDGDPFSKNYKREMRARQHRLIPVSHDPFKT